MKGNILQSISFGSKIGYWAKDIKPKIYVDVAEYVLCNKMWKLPNKN